MTSIEELDGILDLQLKVIEQALPEFDDPDYDLPSYLYWFYDNPKSFDFDKWRDLSPDDLYKEVGQLIMKKRPDAVCLITDGLDEIAFIP